jgi:hypothetical protein
VFSILLFRLVTAQQVDDATMALPAEVSDTPAPLSDDYAATSSQPQEAAVTNPSPLDPAEDVLGAPDPNPAPEDTVTTSPAAVGVASGVEAIAYLATRNELAEVAKAYGKTSTQLAELLEQNKDLKLATRTNQLFYTCTGLAVNETYEKQDAVMAGHHHHHHHRKLANVDTEAADPLPSSLQLTASGVPILHSRSSATRKIYLDFDGHVTTGEGGPMKQNGRWGVSLTVRSATEVCKQNSNGPYWLISRHAACTSMFSTAVSNKLPYYCA